MANTARKDRKRLATTDERNPTKESAPKLRAKRKRASGSAEAPKAAPPKRRETPALKAMPPDPDRTAAAPNAESAAPGALKMASPQASSAQEIAPRPPAAPLSASDSKPSGQAPAPTPRARPAAANVRGANRANDAVHQSLGLDAAALPRRASGAGRHARPTGQAVLRLGMARQSVLRFHQTGLCVDHALGGRSRQAGR